MEWAIRLAQKGLGRVSPNPPVGCVILNRSQELIGFGYHKVYGGPHAEIEALESVENREELDGGTIFVTLEPCAHYGKTPPCANEITKHPFSRVVIGARDPNPVAANGTTILREAGLKVEFYEPLRARCEEVAEVFFLNHQFKRTFVHAKVATSIDGQMGMASGESQWITNEKSRQYTQKLRGETDAVLIGYNTFKNDNPRLNSRHPEFFDKKNKVVILDPEGNSFGRLKGSALVEVRELSSVIVVVSDKTNIASAPAGLTILKIPMDNGQLSLDDLLKELFANGIFSVLVEGGATTLGAFLNQKKVDRISIMIAPVIIGAKNGMAWTKDFGVSKLEDKTQLLTPTLLQFGSDLCLTARIDSGFS